MPPAVYSNTEPQRVCPLQENTIKQHEREISMSSEDSVSSPTRSSNEVSYWNTEEYYSARSRDEQPLYRKARQIRRQANFSPIVQGEKPLYKSPSRQRSLSLDVTRCTDKVEAILVVDGIQSSGYGDQDIPHERVVDRVKSMGCGYQVIPHGNAVDGIQSMRYGGQAIPHKCVVDAECGDQSIIHKSLIDGIKNMGCGNRSTPSKGDNKFIPHEGVVDGIQRIGYGNQVIPHKGMVDSVQSMGYGDQSNPLESVGNGVQSIGYGNQSSPHEGGVDGVQRIGCGNQFIPHDDVIDSVQSMGYGDQFILHEGDLGGHPFQLEVLDTSNDENSNEVLDTCGLVGHPFQLELLDESRDGNLDFEFRSDSANLATNPRLHKSQDDIQSGLSKGNQSAVLFKDLLPAPMINSHHLDDNSTDGMEYLDTSFASWQPLMFDKSLAGFESLEETTTSQNISTCGTKTRPPLTSIKSMRPMRMKLEMELSSGQPQQEDKMIVDYAWDGVGSSSSSNHHHLINSLKPLSTHEKLWSMSNNFASQGDARARYDSVTDNRHEVMWDPSVSLCEGGKANVQEALLPKHHIHDGKSSSSEPTYLLQSSKQFQESVNGLIQPHCCSCPSQSKFKQPACHGSCAPQCAMGQESHAISLLQLRSAIQQSACHEPHVSHLHMGLPPSTCTNHQPRPCVSPPSPHASPLHISHDMRHVDHEEHVNKMHYPPFPHKDAAPYVLCQHCHTLLEVPVNLPLKQCKVHKICCSFCLKVSRFSTNHVTNTKISLTPSVCQESPVNLSSHSGMLKKNEACSGENSYEMMEKPGIHEANRSDIRRLESSMLRESGLVLEDNIMGSDGVPEQNSRLESSVLRESGLVSDGVPEQNKMHEGGITRLEKWLLQSAMLKRNEINFSGKILDDKVMAEKPRLIRRLDKVASQSSRMLKDYAKGFGGNYLDDHGMPKMYQVDETGIRRHDVLTSRSGMLKQFGDNNVDDKVMAEKPRLIRRLDKVASQSWMLKDYAKGFGGNYLDDHGMPKMYGVDETGIRRHDVLTSQSGMLKQFGDNNVDDKVMAEKPRLIRRLDKVASQSWMLKDYAKGFGGNYLDDYGMPKMYQVDETGIRRHDILTSQSGMLKQFGDNNVDGIGMVKTSKVNEAYVDMGRRVPSNMPPESYLLKRSDMGSKTLDLDLGFKMHKGRGLAGLKSMEPCTLPILKETLKKAQISESRGRAHVKPAPTSWPAPAPEPGASLLEHFAYDSEGLGAHMQKASWLAALASSYDVKQIDVTVDDHIDRSLYEGQQDMKRDPGSVEKGPKAITLKFLKKSLSELGSAGRKKNNASSQVMINGSFLPDAIVKQAKDRAGTILPGSYWYDPEAGFWGVMGGPCLGIIPPFIEELNLPMPEGCAGGTTGVMVNGRELHTVDLQVLGGRGLPTTRGKAYMVEISGKVVDCETGKELKSLGKLAPTVEKKGRGYGMFQPWEAKTQDGKLTFPSDG